MYIKPYIFYYVPNNDTEMGGYYWDCAGTTSSLFISQKECEVDFMWFLLKTNKLVRGEIYKF